MTASRSAASRLCGGAPAARAIAAGGSRRRARRRRGGASASRDEAFVGRRPRRAPSAARLRTWEAASGARGGAGGGAGGADDAAEAAEPRVRRALRAVIATMRAKLGAQLDEANGLRRGRGAARFARRRGRRRRPGRAAAAAAERGGVEAAAAAAANADAAPVGRGAGPRAGLGALAQRRPRGPARRRGGRKRAPRRRGRARRAPRRVARGDGGVADPRRSRALRRRDGVCRVRAVGFMRRLRRHRRPPPPALGHPRDTQLIGIAIVSAPIPSISPSSCCWKWTFALNSA